MCSSRTTCSGINRHGVSSWPTACGGAASETMATGAEPHRSRGAASRAAEAWRPIAQDFDVFFGLEAATNAGLTSLVKDTTVDRTVEAVGIARALGYGVTGNFVVDPDWDEADFRASVEFCRKHELSRAGFTILHSCRAPRTSTTQPRLRAVRWAQYDMHHVLWEPRLGARRFFDLYCETWRRSILNLSGEKSWRLTGRARSACGRFRFLRACCCGHSGMMRPEDYASPNTCWLNRAIARS